MKKILASKVFESFIEEYLFIRPNLIDYRTIKPGTLNVNSGFFTPVNNGYEFVADFIDVSNYNLITLTLFDTIVFPESYTGRLVAYDANWDFIRHVNSTLNWRTPKSEVYDVTDVTYVRLMAECLNSARYKLEEGNFSTPFIRNDH